MKQQQGAALIIVMALLSGALMLGISGMRTALIDEQLAGNYRASVQAQMNSDSMMSEFRNYSSLDLLDNIYTAECEESQDCYQEFKRDFLDHLSTVKEFETLEKVVDIRVDKEKGTITVVTRDQGTNNNADRETTATYGRLSEGDNSEENGSGDSTGSNDSGVIENPFASPVVGCEGVSSAGGSTISSYRSSEGAWSGQPGRFADNDIPLIRTTAENADVILGRSEQIHGGIEALGSVILNGSSQVFGSINSNSDVNLNTSSSIHGDVASKGEVSVGPATVKGSVFSDGNVTLANGGSKVEGDVESFADVIFTESGRVDGVLKSGGDIDFQNWGASVGKGVYAQGDINSPRKPPYNPPEGHVDEAYRTNFFHNTSVSIAEIEEIGPHPCDTANFAGNSLSEEIERYQMSLTSSGDVRVGAYPNEEWRLTPQQMGRFDKTWNVNRWVTHASPETNTLMGNQTPIYRVNNLRLTSSPSLRVSGGDVVIVVDGDFTMGGGGPGLVIDPDSSLTVFVAGQTDFGSVLNMSSANSINSNGKPTFSLFSGYKGAGNGVNFSSSNRVVANVYAPYTGVSVNSGSGFFGSVRGRSVSVSGGGSVVYDELLVDAFGDSENGTPEEGNNGNWQLVGWQ
ncbi:DUF7305 domain-containing protein [Halomonas sp. AOP13-D3-9]